MKKRHLVFFLLGMPAVCLMLCAAWPSAGTRVNIGTVSDFPAGKIEVLPNVKLIIFSDPEGIYAISTKCTHRGCTVNFNKALGGFHCSCHGAKFDENGSVLRKPATANLPWFAIEQDNDGQLWVDKTKAVFSGTKFKFKAPSS